MSCGVTLKKRHPKIFLGRTKNVEHVVVRLFLATTTTLDVNASKYYRKNVVPLRAVPRFCQDGFVGLFVRTVDGREAKIDARID